MTRRDKTISGVGLLLIGLLLGGFAFSDAYAVGPSAATQFWYVFIATAGFAVCTMLALRGISRWLDRRRGEGSSTRTEQISSRWLTIFPAIGAAFSASLVALLAQFFGVSAQSFMSLLGSVLSGILLALGALVLLFKPYDDPR